MQQIKQNFKVIRNGEAIAFRYVIAGNEDVARELIIDYLETNWDGGEYEITSTEDVETDQKANVY